MQRPKPQCIDVRGDTPYPCMGWYQTLGKSPPPLWDDVQCQEGNPLSPLWDGIKRGNPL